MGSLTTTPRQSKRRLYSPHMVGYWPMTTGNFNDLSGNGLDLSILNAPRWTANVAYRLGAIVLPTALNNRYYWCSAAGTSGASDPTAGWTTTVGATQTDGPNTLVWTCSDYVDYFGLNAFATFPANKPAQVYSACRRPWQLVDYLYPPQDGNVVYESAAATVTSATSDRSINDSANGFPIFALNDWVHIGGEPLSPIGFTVDPINNAIGKVASNPSTTGKITFLAGTAINSVGAAAKVRIRKVLPPASMVLSFWHTTSMTGGSFEPLSFLESTVGSKGLYFRVNSSRVASYNSVNWNGTSATSLASLAATSGTARHWVFVINRDLSTITTYRNGFIDAANPLTKQQQTSLAQNLANLPDFFLGGSATPMNAAMVYSAVQLYVGRNLPAGLTGATTPTPALVTQLFNGVPLSPTDWP